VKILIWLFPRSWRERYGEEIADHLAHSTRSGRDRLDLLIALAPMWSDDRRRLSMHAARRWPRIAAAALVGIGAAATLWAASELEGGASELLHHWWSTLAVLVPLTAAAVAVGLELAARRIARRTRR
jgi:small-conductance mechanosensitive channel